MDLSGKQKGADEQYRIGYSYYTGDGVKQDYRQAVKWFRLAAEQGHALAQYYVGYCYAKGKGVPKSFEEAVKWLKLSAEQDNPDAQHYLGLCYELGIGVPKDIDEAIRLYKSGAAQGHLKAQCALGEIYYYGFGIPKNYDEAVKWFCKAAAGGDAEAQYHLGRCYLYGDGVSKSNEIAVRLIRLSAENGNPHAQFDLAGYYSSGAYGVAKDYIEAVKLYRLAASQGFSKAQVELGVCYLNGWCGINKDYKEALTWFRTASDHGDAEGTCNLGECYYYGYGVSQDYKKAFRLFNIASERNAHAQYMVGECYYAGTGVSKDKEKALKIFQQCNDPYAENKLGYFYLIGRHLPLDYKNAFNLFLTNGIIQNHIDSIFHLGEISYYGYGRPVDYGEAVKDFKKAAERGHVGAQYYLGLCYFYGNGVTKDYNEALKWFKRAADQGEDKLLNGFESPEVNVVFPDDVKKVILTCLHGTSNGGYTAGQYSSSNNSDTYTGSSKTTNGATSPSSNPNPSSKNKNGSRSLRIIMLVLLVGVIILCIVGGKQRRMIRTARRSGNIEMYNAYLKEFPYGKFVNAAIDSVANISERQTFAKACRSRDVDDYLDYMSEFPEGKYIDKAMAAIVSLAEKCEDVATVCGYASKAEKLPTISASTGSFSRNGYSNYYGAGKRSDMNKERNMNLSHDLGQIAYRLANEENTLSGWTNFRMYAPDEFKPKAQVKIDSLKAIEARKWGSESSAWKMASSSDSYENYEKYLELYPNGAHARQAEKRLIDLEVANDFAGEHGKLPPMDKTSVSFGVNTSIEIHNDTEYELTILYSGPDSRRVVLKPHGTKTVTLSNGAYLVSAKVREPGITPFVGNENLDGSDYEVTFYIKVIGY